MTSKENDASFFALPEGVTRSSFRKQAKMLLAGVIAG